MWSPVASTFASDHFWFRPWKGTTTSSLIILTFYKYGSTNWILQGSFFPRREWFWFSGVQGNIQVTIWPGFRRCASRHSAIHPKGCAIPQTVGNEGRPNSFKAGSEAIKEGATVKDVIKSTLKPTVGAVLGATVDQVASKLIEIRDNQNDAPPPNPPIVVPEFVQAGSGKKQRSRSVYKKTPKCTKYSSK